MIIKKCEICSKKIITYPCRIKIGAGKCCSIKCLNIFKKGKKRPEEIRKRISQTLMGHIVTPETRIKISKGHKGKKLSFEHIQNLRKSHIGQIAWNKGKPYFQIRGKKHPNWKGGKKIVRKYFYILKPNHSYKTKQGYIKQSRYIMEQQLKRYLNPEEVVHHINKNTLDDRIENLMLFKNNTKHLKFHKKK